MAYEIPTTLTSRCNCFVDDAIQISLDTRENRRRLPLLIQFMAKHLLPPSRGRR
jgi:hypothetical protein